MNIGQSTSMEKWLYRLYSPTPSLQRNLPKKFGTEKVLSLLSRRGNVYKIATGSQLAWVAQQVNTQHDSWQDREHFSNKELIQVADIDLGGHEFPGIGADINYYFGGTYDGQGYSIKNFTINRPDSTTGNYAGVFNYIRGATVKNLTVNDATITGYSNVGGIAGYVYGGTVENCKNYATVQRS